MEKNEDLDKNDSYISEVSDKPSLFDSIKNFFNKQKALPPANDQHIKTTMFSVNFLEGFNKFKNSLANIGEIASKAITGKKEKAPANTLAATVIQSESNEKSESKSIDDNELNTQVKPIMPKTITRDTINKAIKTPNTLINNSVKKEYDDTEEFEELKLEKIEVENEHDVEIEETKSTEKPQNVENTISVGDIKIDSQKSITQDPSEHDDR